MNEQLTIPARYCGPPGSANGGYACGLTASALGGSGVEVTLRAPPPLDRPLTLQRNNSKATLVDGDRVIADARLVDEPDSIVAAVPDALRYEDVVAAASSFNVETYLDDHEYPTCFTCGPSREPGDGLRIFPASTARPELVVWPWTPDVSLFGTAGDLDEPVIWAALDCQSGLSWVTREPGAFVLDKMAVVIRRSPAPGERLIVAGWSGQAEGRRRPAGSAIYSESGEILAAGQATWILLTDEQQRAFAGGPS